MKIIIVDQKTQPNAMLSTHLNIKTYINESKWMENIDNANINQKQEHLY